MGNCFNKEIDKTKQAQRDFQDLDTRIPHDDDTKIKVPIIKEEESKKQVQKDYQDLNTRIPHDDAKTIRVPMIKKEETKENVQIELKSEVPLIIPKMQEETLIVPKEEEKSFISTKNTVTFSKKKTSTTVTRKENQITYNGDFINIGGMKIVGGSNASITVIGSGKNCKTIINGNCIYTNNEGVNFVNLEKDPRLFCQYTKDDTTYGTEGKKTIKGDVYKNAEVKVQNNETGLYTKDGVVTDINMDESKFLVMINVEGEDEGEEKYYEISQVRPQDNFKGFANGYEYEIFDNDKVKREDYDVERTGNYTHAKYYANKQESYFKNYKCSGDYKQIEHYENGNKKSEYNYSCSGNYTDIKYNEITGYKKSEYKYSCSGDYTDIKYYETTGNRKYYMKKSCTGAYEEIKYHDNSEQASVKKHECTGANTYTEKDENGKETYYKKKPLVGNTVERGKRKYSYVHAQLSQQVPFYQSMEAPKDMITDTNDFMAGYEMGPNYSDMYSKVINNDNPEEMEYASFLFFGIFIVAVVIKTIKKIGRSMQGGDTKSKQF